MRSWNKRRLDVYRVLGEGIVSKKYLRELWMHLKLEVHI